MARQSQSTKQPRKQAKPTRRSLASEGKQPLLSAEAHRDIAGVVCVVLALVLGIVSYISQDGLLTGWLFIALHFLFGQGMFILPVALLIIGGSLFFRKDTERMSLRIALGIAVMFFALLVIISLSATDGATSDATLMFHVNRLSEYGGAIGNIIALGLVILIGVPASYVVMLGCMVIALIIIGFSLTKFVDKIRARSQESDASEAEQLPLKRSFIDRLRARKQIPQEDMAEFTQRASKMPTQKIPRERPSVKRKQGTSPRISASPEEIESRATQVLSQVPANAKTQALTRRLGAEKADPAPKKPARRAVTPKPQEGFELPSMDLLHVSKHTEKDKESEETLRETAMLLQETLADFSVAAEVVGWVAGPTVTLFKVDLPSGVRVSRVTNLTDDIALALAAPGVRIFAPIPGTNYVGIEVPNMVRQNVLLGDVLKYADAGPLQVAIGKDVEGHALVSDLAKMPHLLIGGTTGSGKSVSINAMIMSILMRATPSEVRFIMIDPKRVEFTPYNGIPHLYVPVVTECKEAASALSWAVAEMERRLKVFSQVGARNISQYNSKAQSGMMIGDEPAAEVPYIVIIIDELADLMMNVGKEVEFSISRLAQLARAAGIHMIVATQRPSTNVVTGLIKANITNRIAFNVASGIDSRVILDTPGAENLIGLGDMLLSKPEFAKPQRLQGCFVTEEEISAVVEQLKAQGEPEYHSEILQTNVMSLGDTNPSGNGGGGNDDPLIWEAADIVVNSGIGSTSNIQRRLKVGYSRAGRIMDMLEEKGIVGPQNGSKPREVLVDVMELETLKAFEEHDA